MKIGIMTMQKIKNYGSFLQSYSLKKNIEALGGDVEFVDYVVEPCLNIQVDSNKKLKKDIIGVIRRRLGIYKKNEKLFLEMKKFKQRYDDEFFGILYGTGKFDNYLPELDALVIGSDEVFNCLQKNPNIGYSKQLFGKDNNAKLLISYAASFGNTTLDGLKKYNIADEIKDLLSKFDAISVRDNNSKEIVNSLLGTEPVMHVDPVFLYDYQEIDRYDIKLKDYIVVYAYNNRIKPNEAEKIKALATKMKKKIVCLGEYQNFCDIYIPADPFEMLAYIKSADYVISDTFHGTVFSIKLNKKFAVITRNSKNGAYGNEEKLLCLLKQFNLENRIVNDIDNIEACMTKEVDYVPINKKIQDEKERSISYLKNQFLKLNQI